MKAFLASAWTYVRRNWKPVAAGALAIFVLIDNTYHVVPPDVHRTIIGVAAALGIYLGPPGDSPEPQTVEQS